MDKQTPEFDIHLLQPAESVSTEPVRRYSLCPQCGTGKLDYNGLLELECPICGFVQREGAGCS